MASVPKFPFTLVSRKNPLKAVNCEVGDVCFDMGDNDCCVFVFKGEVERVFDRVCWSVASLERVSGCPSSDIHTAGALIDSNNGVDSS